MEFLSLPNRTPSEWQQVYCLFGLFLRAKLHIPWSPALELPGMGEVLDEAEATGILVFPIQASHAFDQLLER